jgi:hypothetical protein
MWDDNSSLQTLWLWAKSMKKGVQVPEHPLELIRNTLIFILSDGYS